MSTFVRVHGSTDISTFKGERNGYSYAFLESASNGHMLYSLTNPTGVTKVVEVDTDGALELTSDPEGFWKKYVMA